MWSTTISGRSQCRSNCRTESQTLAQKAVAAGFPGEQVDGNDVIAVRAASEAAIAAAREGNGPRLIEAVTYRLGDHTTADDAARYRSPEEVQARWKEEPIARLRSYLVSRAGWSKAEEEGVVSECEQRVAAAIESYLAAGSRRLRPCSTISMPSCDATRQRKEIED